MSMSGTIRNKRRVMNNNFHQEEFVLDNLKDDYSNKLSSRMLKKGSSISNFSLDPHLLRELNVRYLDNISVPRTTHPERYSPNEHNDQHRDEEHYLNILTPPNDSSLDKLSKNHLSPSAKKCNKWCSAHIRISWMICEEQQRLKEKLFLFNNQIDEEASLNNRLSHLISNTKSIVSSSLFNHLSFPSLSTYQTSFLPSPNLNFRSPFDLSSPTNTLFGRVPPSQSSAFGGLASLFPSSLTPFSSIIDRKSDINGSVTIPNVDWTRYARGFGPFSSTNDDLSSNKVDETNNGNESRKRSFDVLHNGDDHRRRSYHHLVHSPSTHIINNQSSPSNRSRSRSPHDHYPSSEILNKNSSCSPFSLKMSSSNIKSDNSKISSHSPPASFPTFNPLTLSIIERQRLLAAYGSLFALAAQTTNYFPNTFDPRIFRHRNSSTLFQNDDPSPMTATLIQRQYFINSLRLSQQQQHDKMIERQRTVVVNSNAAQMNTTSKSKIDRISSRNNEEIAKIKAKDAVSPLSNSSTSSSSSSSKKVKYIERRKASPSAPPSSSTENNDLT